MNNFRRIAVTIGISLLLLACSGGNAPESEAGSSTGGTSGAMIFPAMGVAELDTFLAKNSGKPTLLLFWATWCPSCKQEIPELEQLNTSHGDKLNIITVSLDENKAALDAYFAHKTIKLPVYHGDQGIARKFAVEAIPTLAIFDKTGKQIFSRAGIFPHDMLVVMTQKLIEQ